jgi:hypothetical protein
MGVSPEAVHAKRPEAGRLLAVSADAGIGGIGTDVVSTMHAGVDIREGSLALGIFGRVRLEFAGGPAVRKRDYDEVSDYVHLLRYLRYQRRFGKLQIELRAGEQLGLTLGHGTLVRDYSNVTDPDHLHSGALLRISHPVFRLEAMLDNLVRPQVIGVRSELRPFRKARDLVFGATSVTDPQAPLVVLRDETGLRSIDSAALLRTRNKAISFAGVDVSYTLRDGERRKLTLYSDINTSFYGLGAHFGVSGSTQIGKSPVRLALQLEYRINSDGYSPGYFGTFYDLERYQAGLSFTDATTASHEQRQTKLRGIARGSYGGQGFLGQLGVDGGRYARVKIGYRYHPGPDGNQLWVRAISTPTDKLSIGALVVARGLGDTQGVAGLAAIGEARYRVTDNLYLLAQYNRRWSMDEETRYLVPLQQLNFALGGSLSR